MTRPVHRYVKLELEWKPSWWMSNLALYEYKRHVVGLIVRVHSDWSNDNQFRMKAKKCFFGNEGH